MAQREILCVTGKNGGSLFCWILFLILTNERFSIKTKDFMDIGTTQRCDSWKANMKHMVGSERKLGR